MDFLYKKGAYKALTDLGFKLAEEYDEEEQGAPFPEKSETINAERLARMLRDSDEEEKENKEPIAPENPNYAWDRPVTWQSPINLSGLDGGGGSPGVMLPGSPRG
jgi:hypothetical protein